MASFLYQIYSVLRLVVLFCNAIVILDRERFLDRAGMIPPPSGAIYRDPFITDSKIRFGSFVTSMQTVLRLPLIFLDLVIITYELFLG